MNEKNIKQQTKTLNLFSFLSAVFLFMITQILGIFVASRIQLIVGQQALLIVQQQASLILNEIVVYLRTPTIVIREEWFILFFITFFLLISFVFFFILKSLRKKRKIKLFLNSLFSLAIFIGSLYFFSLFFVFPYDIVFSILFIFLWFLIAQVWFHNLVFIVITASLIAPVGIYIIPLAVAIILIFLAIYDLIAVYWTKHMTVMAKKMIKTGVIFGLIIPVKLKGFFMKLNNIDQAREKAKIFFIGGGDIGLPLLLVVSVYFHYDFVYALIIAALSVVGFIATYLFFVSQKTIRPIPALPGIVIFPVLGYFLLLLI